jgi:hypothetical protein
VFATGRLIKGLYYSEAPSGQNAIAAFYMACDRLLERTPFLMMDFRSRLFFLDGNRDGCVDTTGTLPLAEIDPADFMPAVDGAGKYCNEDLLGEHWLNDLVTTREWLLQRSWTHHSSRKGPPITQTLMYAPWSGAYLTRKVIR